MTEARVYEQLPQGLYSLPDVQQNSHELNPRPLSNGKSNAIVN